jgi:hypothetical protein
MLADGQVYRFSYPIYFGAYKGDRDGEHHLAPIR